MKEYSAIPQISKTGTSPSDVVYYHIQDTLFIEMVKRNSVVISFNMNMTSITMISLRIKSFTSVIWNFNNWYKYSYLIQIIELFEP